MAQGSKKTQTLGAQLYDILLPEKVSSVDMLRYKRYGTNWTYLAAHLAMGVTTEELGILLHIELHGLNRANIVHRLVGSLGARMRDEFRREVADRHPSEPKE